MISTNMRISVTSEKEVHCFLCLKYLIIKKERINLSLTRLRGLPKVLQTCQKSAGFKPSHMLSDNCFLFFLFKYSLINIFLPVTLKSRMQGWGLWGRVSVSWMNIHELGYVVGAQWTIRSGLHGCVQCSAHTQELRLAHLSLNNNKWCNDRILPL